MRPVPEQHWNVHFQVLGPLAGQAWPRRVAAETVRPGQGYRHRGALRRGASHCLFKYTLAGCGHYEDHDGSRAVPPGWGFFCPIAEPSLVYAHPETGAPWHFLFVAVECELRLVQAMRERFGPLYRLAPGHPLIRRLLAFAARDGQTVDLSAGAARRLAEAVLDALIAAGEAQVAGRQGGADLVDEARRRIAGAAEDRPPGVADLATTLGVSREHLGRCFRRRLGCSVSGYIQEQRCRRAAELLADPEATITVVAERLGYDTPSHFARAFRRVLGTSPGDFRRCGWPG